MLLYLDSCTNPLFWNIEYFLPRYHLHIFRYSRRLNIKCNINLPFLNKFLKCLLYGNFKSFIRCYNCAACSSIHDSYSMTWALTWKLYWFEILYHFVSIDDTNMQWYLQEELELRPQNHHKKRYLVCLKHFWIFVIFLKKITLLSTI